MADRLLKGTDNLPSSTARPGASPPSNELLPPGRQGRLPGVQSDHDYSWRLQTSVPNGSAPHLESLASGWLLPGFTVAVHRRAPLRPSRGPLRWLPPPARGCSGGSLGLRRQAFNGHRCRCLNLSTSIGGTRSKVEGGDRHDLEPEGLREDIRHKIYTGSGSQSSYPTSCLEYIAPCAWVLFPGGIGCSARYPALLYIVQGAGS
jgi:hypothetical protein